ncbi:MAG TPA: hypothetical protein PLJ00_06090 [Chitinophagales bacterium]|nr:hypothetical protein [Chitinophagales bacterium]HRG86352.1 hypothetical protein [Chitinophagales bacterium]HRH53681.1 hypothetical protein [Chitinophagales bacterium]
MKKLIIFPAIILLLSSCQSFNEIAIVPTTPENDFEDTYTIIWNGKSEAYRYIDGEYKRDETYDYVFNVIQKRYDKQWKSTKTLHRNHPDYDFNAGERSQSMYFELNYTAAVSGLTTILNTSLGNGTGVSDREFREQILEIQLLPSISYYNISKYAPYNRIKITQHYQYETGVLLETVELYQDDDGKITPFMKNEERATFYVKGTFNGPPTSFQ